MLKTVKLVAATLAVTAASTAFAGAPERSFTRDGQTYVYTVTTMDRGTLIAGRSYPAGEAFRLLVRGNRVSGTTGGRPVAFRVDEARAPANVVAAR